jgi:hypothetical protein
MEVRDITDYCYSGKKQIIIGCDTNAHHTVGEHWHQFKRRKLHGIPGQLNLNILNHGKEPTFVVCNRKEVIALTLKKPQWS